MIAAFTIALVAGGTCPAAPPAKQPAAKPISFIHDVAPIFKENCFACHDSRKRKGKLDMTTYASLRKGRGDDDPITPGHPEDSDLFERITAKGSRRMPPKDGGEPLSKTQIHIIQQWIRQGAKLDGAVQPTADLLRELRIRWEPPIPPTVYPYPVDINAVIFTPDGKKLVVGGYHELTVWDVAQGKLEKRVRMRAERAKAMVFLPDGKLIVAGSRPGQEGDVRIYDLNGSAPHVVGGIAYLDGVHDSKVMLKQLLDTDDEVLCLALSPDGKKLASGGCDRLVRVWDLSRGWVHARLDQTIENHADWVFGVAFSPDGKRLLTASRDKTAKVWDLAAKESVITFPEHQAGVFGVAISPDGKVGVSVGQDNQVRYWNTGGEGKQIRTSGGHGGEIFKVIWNAKPPLLVTCSADKTVRLWNPDNGSLIRALTGHTDQVYAIALSPDAKQVASGSWNGQVIVWNVADGKVVRSFNASPGLARQVTRGK
ncbi:MAG TPA: c-type cytochrome domain-containing protein [Gemmataceae bacterium]|nr:c-type cytochrome domain-containing protein [Gemmataceae bacterium]